MIVFDDVRAGYESNNEVLHGISFEIPDKVSVGLIGANGAGKSTIIKAALGLINYSGNITVNGLRVEKKNLSEIRKIMGYVMQNSDNQMFMPRVYDDMAFAPKNYGKTAEETEQKIDEVLKALGIEELKYSYNHKLSGGEKKMASIATILTMDPEMLIMDEPTSMLDPYNRRKVLDIINSLPQTKLIASHDLDFIYDTCQYSLIIFEGEIKGFGPSDQILRDKKLLEDCHLELPYRFVNI